MARTRPGTSTRVRMAGAMSVRASSRSPPGTCKPKLPLPEGRGKISPSMSQKALTAPYRVSLGAFRITGRRG